jgi:hypothetical protein
MERYRMAVEIPGGQVDGRKYEWEDTCTFLSRYRIVKMISDIFQRGWDIYAINT